MKNLLIINLFLFTSSSKKLIFVFILLLLLPFTGCKSVVKETVVEEPVREEPVREEPVRVESVIVITATAPETSPPKSDEDYRKIRDQNWFERFHNNYIELLNLEDKSKRISEAEETLRKIEKAIGEDDLLNSERTIELKLKLTRIILGKES